MLEDPRLGSRGPTATASQAADPPRLPAAVLGAEGQSGVKKGGPVGSTDPDSSWVGAAMENRTFFFLGAWAGPRRGSLRNILRTLLRAALLASQSILQETQSHLYPPWQLQPGKQRIRKA